MATLKNVTKFINEFLEIDKFRDYAPNGLQVEVEGEEKLTKIITGVSASHASSKGSDSIDFTNDILRVSKKIRCGKRGIREGLS